MAGARCGGACAPPFPPPRPGRAGAPSGRPPARAHRGCQGRRRPCRGAAAGESAHELPWRRLRSLRRRLRASMPAPAARAGWGALGQTSSEGTPGLPGPVAAVSRRCRRRRRRPPAWWQCLRTTLPSVFMPARAPTNFHRHAHVACVLRGCPLRGVWGFLWLLQARKCSTSGFWRQLMPSSSKSGQDGGLCSPSVTSEADETPEYTALCSRARSRVRWGVEMYQKAARAGCEVDRS